MFEAKLFLLLLAVLDTINAGSHRPHKRQNKEVLPVILKAPKEQTFLEMKPLVLTCEAKGTPKPKITWQKNGRDVSKARYTIKNYAVKDGAGSVLWIEEAKRRGKGGANPEFKCIATNQLGSAEETAVVNIIPERSRPSGFPYIDINPTVKSVEKKGDIAMICSASGSPTPDIYWYKDFKRLRFDDHITMTPTGDILNLLRSYQKKFEKFLPS